MVCQWTQQRSTIYGKHAKRAFQRTSLLDVQIASTLPSKRLSMHGHGVTATKVLSAKSSSRACNDHNSYACNVPKNTHTYIHTYVHSCIRVYVRTSIRTYVRMYVRMPEKGGLLTPALGYVYIYIYIYIYLFIYIYIYIYIYYVFWYEIDT